MTDLAPSAPPQDDEVGARQVLLRLVPAGLALALVLSVIGWVLVTVLTPSALTEWEQDLNRSWFLGRTEGLDLATGVGSTLSDTVTCIAVLVVAALVLRWRLGRWRESWTVAAAITGELLVFLVVTAVVGRDRPSVPQLDAAPPTSSFPSGHTAAAVALYGCIAIIVARNLRSRWMTTVVVVVCASIPIVVALSRVYRGMHHPSDVLFGILGGGAWLLIVVATMLPRRRSIDVSSARTVDAGAERSAEPEPARRT
jgi:membrane-associated phospholipid phosphatase